MYNFVECVKCKNEFSFEKGDPNSVVKDGKGNKLEGYNNTHNIDHYYNTMLRIVLLAVVKQNNVSNVKLFHTI